MGSLASGEVLGFASAFSSIGSYLKPWQTQWKGGCLQVEGEITVEAVSEGQSLPKCNWLKLRGLGGLGSLR